MRHHSAILKNTSTDKHDMPNTINSNTNTDELLKAGDLLKQAREDAKLTQKEVAFELKLSTNFIQLIEQNEFDQLPSDVFARGYVCSYARFLEIPEKKILKHFDISRSKESQIQNLNEGIGKLGKIDKKHFNLNRPTRFNLRFWLILIISAVLVTMFIFWLQKNARKEDMVTGVSDTDNHYVVSTDETADKVVTSNIESSDNKPSKNHTEIKQTHISKSNQKNFPPFNYVRINAMQESEHQGSQALELQLNSLFNHSQLVPRKIQKAEQKQQKQKAPIIAGRHRVELSFNGDSWVELKQKDTILKTGIWKKNEVIDLEITTPFSLIIGRADVTRLSIDKKLVDVKSLATHNVMHLNVDQSTDVENYIKH